MNAAPPAPRHDAESDIAAWAVGSGIFLIQLCAVIPGLLPCLLLLLPFVLPLVVLGLAAALLVGVPVGIWRLLSWAGGPLAQRLRRTHSTIPTPETSNG
jgi:hypothetical protein